MRTLGIVCLLALPPAAVYAQLIAPAQEEVEQLIDESSDDEDIPVDDLERIAETRAHYARDPIDLNAADAQSLAALTLLTPAQIQGILDRRARSGAYIDVRELQAVPALGLEMVTRLLPYVTIAPSATQTGRKLIGRLRNATTYAAVRTAYQTTAASTDSWAGPRVPLYARVRATAGRQLSLGLVVDQDAGEPYARDSGRIAVDHVGLHAFADDLPGTMQTVALGDFNLNWGQGLVSYTGFGTGKGAAVMNVQRNAEGLLPHASAAEAGYYRGAGVGLRRGPWRATLLASRRALDGAVDTAATESGNEQAFGTLRLGGLHRTPAERAGRGVNPTWSTGGALGYEAPWGRVSAHFLEHRFALPFAAGDRLYQQLSFTGRTMRNASLAWQTFLGPIGWFGEGAVSTYGATALITGVQSALDQRTDVSVVYRRYAPDYHTLYENVFGSTRRPENEEGLYLALRTVPHPAWSIDGFVDLYRHPYARFRLSRASLHRDAFLRVTHRERKRYDLYAQLRYREGERESARDASGELRTVLPFTRLSARMQGEVRLTEALRLRTRVEFSRTRSNGAVSAGTLLYQDVMWRDAGGGWSATARIALVDTDDLESRIYAYENDLLYRFRIPAYYGQGYRTYLNVRYRTTADLTLEARVAYGRRRGSEDQREVAVQLRQRL